MFSKVILAFVAASPLLSVQAQTSSASASLTTPATSSIPPCVLNCSATAAVSSGCGSFTNVTCVCTSAKFQTATLSCLQSNCNATDQAAAVGLQSQLCGSNSTASGSGTPSSAASGTASATSPAASSSSTKSNAAVGLNNGLHVGHAIGIITILAGVITATML